jgi:hypothetical protein
MTPEQMQQIEEFRMGLAIFIILVVLVILFFGSKAKAEAEFEAAKPDVPQPLAQRYDLISQIAFPLSVAAVLIVIIALTLAGNAVVPAR